MEANLIEEQKAFNKGIMDDMMSGFRVTVEWEFKEIKLYFSTIDFQVIWSSKER